MKRRHLRWLSTLFACSLVLSSTGSVRAVTPVPAAGLLVRVTETGKVTLSADGVGVNDPAGALVQASKPSAAATVRSAFLACSSNFDRVINDGDVTLDGTPITWTDSVQNNAGATLPTFFNNVFADVTTLVKPKADAAAPGLVDYTVAEVVDTFTIDGCALYVVFDDPDQATSNTVFILFGGQNTLGDDFAVTLATPLVAGDVAQMGLAIGFSAQDASLVPSNLCGVDQAQFSTIDVNGVRLTSCAGNYDDSANPATNGTLMTVGGIGDDPANPTDPLQQPGDGNPTRIREDELYDLTAFLGPTDTLINVQTLNPSDDDNIFAGHLFVTAPAIVGEGVLLTPETAQNPVGTEHTVTATVVDDNGAPVPDRLVTFTVVSGPNAGAGGTDTTDADGVATFTYTGTGGPGVDTIQASFEDSQGETQTSNAVTKEWTEAPGGSKTICSDLKWHHFGKKLVPDVDVFSFEGTEGERVTITLEDDPDAPDAGSRAILALAQAHRLRLVALEKGPLPNQIVATLPATGRYLVGVSQPFKCKHRGHKHHRGCRRFDSFTGGYCLTLESDGGAADTLKATRWVEEHQKVKNRKKAKRWRK